jgi:tRNA A37 threonylcarbamoyladenosine synthetase subunit TsaC/SUA5/YrdC
MVEVLRLTPGRHVLQDDLVAAKEALIRGGLIITPSDTCFALTVDARDAGAVSVLRTSLGAVDAPLSVAFANFEMLAEYAELGIHSARLAHHLMPGPLTLVTGLTKFGRRRLGDNLNLLGTIGARISESPAERQLSEAINGPVTTTAIRDDRGDLVVDLHDARSIVEKGLISHGHYRPLVVLHTSERFHYEEHSTVVEVTQKGPIEIREGILPWQEVVDAYGQMSRWEISDWT